MFLRSLGETFCTSFHDETGEFVSVHLRKDGIYIGKAAIGDPAFLAIQQVMFSIIAESGRFFLPLCHTTAFVFL